MTMTMKRRSFVKGIAAASVVFSGAAGAEGHESDCSDSETMKFEDCSEPRTFDQKVHLLKNKSPMFETCAVFADPDGRNKAVLIANGISVLTPTESQRIADLDLLLSDLVTRNSPNRIVIEVKPNHP